MVDPVYKNVEYSLRPTQERREQLTLSYLLYESNSYLTVIAFMG